MAENTYRGDIHMKEHIHQRICTQKGTYTEKIPTGEIYTLKDKYKERYTYGNILTYKSSDMIII